MVEIPQYPDAKHRLNESTYQRVQDLPIHSLQWISSFSTLTCDMSANGVTAAKSDRHIWLMLNSFWTFSASKLFPLFSPTFTQLLSFVQRHPSLTFWDDMMLFREICLVMFDQTKKLNCIFPWHLSCRVYFLGILSAAGHQFDTVDLGFLSLLPRHGRFCGSELDQGNCLRGVDSFFWRRAGA